MCGIAGKYIDNSEKVTFDTVSAMCEEMHYRGPDNQGVEVCDKIVLGHRRLSIIDLTTDANMPMFSDDKQYCLTYNGEFYNFMEVRSELENKGYKFHTNSDSEVLLNAFIEYREGCLSKINGMFAFAIWDNIKKQLFVVRDRFGQKPFFYSLKNNKFSSFASELKAFRVDPSIEMTVSYPAINEYLALGYILTPSTQYEQIKSLEPATFMYIDQEGKIIRKERYWDYAETFNHKTKKSEKEIMAELQEEVRQAVYTRMVSDVPIGGFLSGGIDSTSVVSFMKEKHQGELHTFSVGFKNKSYNELPDADRAAEWIKTHHHGLIVGQDNPMELLNNAVDKYDELFSDNSLVPMVEVSKLASEHVTVVLSGDAADELLAGYITYKADKLLPIINAATPRFIRKELAKNRRIRSKKKIDWQFKMQQFFYGSLFDYQKAHYLWRQIFQPEERIAILGEEYRELVYDTDPFHIFKKYYDRVLHLDHLDQHLYVDAMTWLPDDILVKVDRSSMAASIEARAPYLDVNLATYSASIPSELKMKNLVTKSILKKALRGQIPDFVIDKKKSGFNSPVNAWIPRTDKNEFQTFNRYVLNRKNII